ncbi:MAG: ATP-binding protein, partial [Candidatus Margulisiibacteriota bacterium]
RPKFTEVRVIDTGYGIPHDSLESVFERFSRLPKAVEITEGKGLGLSIVKSLVEGHDGAVWAESDGKYGTTFLIRLPLPA